MTHCLLLVFSPQRHCQSSQKPSQNCPITFDNLWPTGNVTDEWLVRMIAGHPIIVGWAEQLLGLGKFDLPERVRGIYCRLPMGDAAEKPLTCHYDVSPDSLHETPFETLLKPGIISRDGPSLVSETAEGCSSG